MSIEYIQSMQGLTFKNFTKEELSDFLHDESREWRLKFSPREYGNSARFEGFYYFNAEELVRFSFGEAKDTQYYLVAFLGDELVGVLSYGIYGYEEYNWGISFIDVKVSHKGTGVATSLIKELNKYITPDMYLRVSRLSDEGKLCKIGELFDRYITVTEVRHAQW